MFGSGFVAPNDFVACALTVPSNFVTVAMWWDGFAFAKLVGQQMRECYYHRIIIRLPPVSADPSWMSPLLQHSFLPLHSTGEQRTWLPKLHSKESMWRKTFEICPQQPIQGDPTIQSTLNKLPKVHSKESTSRKTCGIGLQQGCVNLQCNTFCVTSQTLLVRRGQGDYRIEYRIYYRNHNEKEKPMAGEGMSL